MRVTITGWLYAWHFGYPNKILDETDINFTESDKDPTAELDEKIERLLAITNEVVS